MRKIRLHSWMLVLGVAGLLSLTGCHLGLEDAVAAGMFDFIAGTVADTMGRLAPIAEIAVNGGG